MNYLDKKLVEYKKENIYPFHMPGHKRKELEFENPYSIDITEIDGFDNLHHATNILKEAQQRAADLYGSNQCYYLVNGSTCGILTAILAATKRKGKVLVARNSHKAVYHALFLQELEAEYLYPEITESGIQGQITVAQVKKALDANTNIEAVIITSPTYEGIVSDIKGIAKVVHEKNIPLIVDAAHGAHFGFGGGFPENPVKLGADAVIMSLHKTMPSFTQTALLHLCSERMEKTAIERYLGIFQTSSPSYLFMAGMEACIRMVSEEKENLFSSYREKLNEFYSSIADLKNLHVMKKADLSKEEAFDWDDSKLVIYDKRGRLAGQQLHQRLFNDYKLQMEMVSGYYVLGMTSMMDEKEGFTRLSEALHQIDDTLEFKPLFSKHSGKNFIREMYQKNNTKLQISEALSMPCKEVSFREAEGKISADTIFLYPPGIPMIIPGEVITSDFIEKIEICQNLGLDIEGASNLCEKRIKIV